MIDILINRLIQREGGYVDHPDDRGGPTNMGITARTLAAWRNQEVFEQDIADLSQEEAESIYLYEYWIAPGFAGLDLSPVLNEMVFDAAVHHGVYGATRLLQTAAKVRVDGKIGPVTIKSVQKTRPIELAGAFMSQRVSLIGSIITRQPSQAVFAHGWMNRMGEFIKMIPAA